MDSKLAVKQFNQLKKLVERVESPRLAAEGWKEDWQCLISTMLSAQTRDTTTLDVSEKLFKKFNSLKKLSSLSVNKLEKEIARVNYKKTKARNVHATIGKLIDDFKGKVPREIDSLVLLPGVGRKTANVFLAEHYGAPSIGVDTHVGRLSRKLGWTEKVSPEKVEKDLMKLFPKRYWNSINYVLVKFGQSYGKSRKKEDELLKVIKSKVYK
jgi:endonuclease-3